MIAVAVFAQFASAQSLPIDRKALVTRHNVKLTLLDGTRPLQVGNGEFAFGMDITGLQTFVPFNTMSQWGWDSGPVPAEERLQDFNGQTWITHGRPIRYPMQDSDNPRISNWLASNPHRINLGRIGLHLVKADGTPLLPGDMGDISQTLDLWGGVATSRFEIDGQPVMVKTAVHPNTDTVAVQIFSPLIRTGQIGAFFAYPGDNPKYFANYVGDWNHPGAFEILPSSDGNRVDLKRQLNDSNHFVGLRWQGKAHLEPDNASTLPLKIIKAEYGAGDKWADVTSLISQKADNSRLVARVDSTLAPDPNPGVGKMLKVTYTAGQIAQVVAANEGEELVIDTASEKNRLILRPSPDSPSLSFTCTFSPGSLPLVLPDVQTTFDASRAKWASFWKSGGAIDLSESHDPRWRELERRIVLSQYLMAVNTAGSLPPQESGLVNNGWYGRFHMEMVWWHVAHQALWNRWPLLNRNLSIYSKLLPESKKHAQEQGYSGARWPKCIGPNGQEWPHEIHALLIWQQPHPIFFAELDYRAHPTQATLDKWWPIIEATADFLASYAFYDQGKNRYVLGPPLHVVSENTNPKTTQNPAFELAYWRYGLRTAQLWRERLGLQPDPEWSKVLNGLSPLPQQDGVYVLHEGIENMWTEFNYEHPALTGAFGMLPGDGVDPEIMRRTLDKVAGTWKFDRVWGWDFPMLAMCAARLGKPEQAVDYLLHPSANFQFDERGLATGGPFPYFPSNGGLLYAVAMMAAGWDGASDTAAPGFPQNGQWVVKSEGLSPAQ